MLPSRILKLHEPAPLQTAPWHHALRAMLPQRSSARPPATTSVTLPVQASGCKTMRTPSVRIEIILSSSACCSRNLQQKGDKEEWHRVLATWKTGSIKRQSKNEEGHWRNRPLPDIKSDVKDAVIRSVKDLAESHDPTVGVPPPRTDGWRSVIASWRRRGL